MTNYDLCDYRIEITQEMFEAAVREVERRSPNLKPHFYLGYLSEEARQVLGFLGEFSCATYFGYNWKDYIRKDYKLADKYDLIFKNREDSSISYRIDVKTETLPSYEILNKVMNKQIDDDKPYGRRLIHQYQFENNLSNYNWILFGCFLRPKESELSWNPVGNYWYLIGGIETEKIKENTITRETPFGSLYPEPCVNIRTSLLRRRRKNMDVMFGKKLQINCSNQTFYKFLGYLANHPNDINIVYERNSEQGAWGNESRIHFSSDFVRNKFIHLGINVTAGVSNIDSRLNCNELIEFLYKLGFQQGNTQNLNVIRNNISNDYINDFNNGALM
ncbi:hypothetical protein [Lonepinella sp. BR2357]|uniref:hypothetical protein n=1 Tax=Lonepinella sp. BR2357 TaxID=3434549 RepID=UPI003F6DC8F4